VGVQRYGKKDRTWQQIQRFLLPAKSVSQVVNRYKNQSTRRAPDNPIKNAKLQQLPPPFNHKELELLGRAVAEVGLTFLSCGEGEVECARWGAKKPVSEKEEGRSHHPVDHSACSLSLGSGGKAEYADFCDLIIQ
jgi:hypothetical protein